MTGAQRRETAHQGGDAERDSGVADRMM